MAYNRTADLADLSVEVVSIGFSDATHARDRGYCYMVCGKSVDGGNNGRTFARVVGGDVTCKSCLKRLAKTR